jgi:hypothetical protein
MNMSESTLDMMQLDKRLETLLFQIYAYRKCKEYDHQSLMEYNLDAIKTLCRDIYFRLEAEERRANREQ